MGPNFTCLICIILCHYPFLTYAHMCTHTHTQKTSQQKYGQDQQLPSQHFLRSYCDKSHVYLCHSSTNLAYIFCTWYIKSPWRFQTLFSPSGQWTEGGRYINAIGLGKNLENLKIAIWLVYRGIQLWRGNSSSSTPHFEFLTFNF